MAEIIKNGRDEENGYNVLYKCILGRRADLCSCPDIDGENKDDAWKDYGAVSLLRCGS